MALRSLGSLTLDVIANTSGYTEGLDKAGREAEKFAARNKNAARDSAAQWRKVGFVVGGVFATLAVGTIALIRNAINTADSLNDLSKTTGITVEKLAGLSLASDQSGADLESVARAVSKLSENMGKDSEKFKDIGITAKDPLEAFKQLADVFVSIQDPQARAAFGADALGKSWQTVAPLLSEGGKRIGEMVEKGEKLSGTTQQLAADSDEFNDNLAELKLTTASFGAALAKDLLPGLNAIIGSMRDAYVEGGKLQSVLMGFNRLGAVLFSDEYQSAAVQISNLKDKIEDLKKTDRQFASGFRGGVIQKWLIGSDKDISQTIQGWEAEIWGLQESIKKSAKVDPKQTPPSNQAEELCRFGGGKWDGKRCIKGGSATGQPKVDEFDRYLEGLNKQLQATKDLTVAEKVLDDIRSGRIGKLKDGQKDQLAQTAAQIDAANAIAKASDEAKRTFEEGTIAAESLYESNEKSAESYRDILDPTREIHREMEQIEALVQGGFLTPDEGAAIQVKKLAGEYSELDDFAKEAAKNIQDSLGNSLADAMEGKFSDIGASFKKMLIRMAAEAAAASITRSLFGDNAPGGASKGGSAGGTDAGGWIGMAMSFAKTFFADGGYTGSGSKMEPAGIVHAGEYVINAKNTRKLGLGFLDSLNNKGYAEGGLVGAASGQSQIGTTIVVNVNGSNAPDVRRAAGQGAREALGALSGAQRYA